MTKQSPNFVEDTAQRVISLFQRVGSPTVDPESPVPSLIPWQGPFHVSLNEEESTVLLFRSLFEKLYKALFGRNKVQTTTPRNTLCTLYDTKKYTFLYVNVTLQQELKG